MAESTRNTDREREPEGTTDGGRGIAFLIERKSFMGSLVVVAIIAIALFAAFGNRNAAKVTVPSDQMTTTANGTITQVVTETKSRRTASGDSLDTDAYRYEVSYEDASGKSHTALSSETTRKRQYEQGDSVEIRYSSSNPDGGCTIVRRTKSKEPEPTSGQPSNASSGAGSGHGGTTGTGGTGTGSTIAQQWLSGDPDSGSDDPLSDIIHQNSKRH